MDLGLLGIATFCAVAKVKHPRMTLGIYNIYIYKLQVASFRKVTLF